MKLHVDTPAGLALAVGPAARGTDAALDALRAAVAALCPLAADDVEIARRHRAAPRACLPGMPSGLPALSLSHHGDRLVAVAWLPGAELSPGRLLAGLRAVVDP